MPLLYPSEFERTEIDARPLRITVDDPAAFGRAYDDQLARLVTRLREHFSDRAANVAYSPAHQEIAIEYQSDGLEDHIQYRYRGHVRPLLNVTDGQTMSGEIEVYFTVSAEVDCYSAGYRTVFNNRHRLHLQLLDEIKGVIDES